MATLIKPEASFFNEGSRQHRQTATVKACLLLPSHTLHCSSYPVACEHHKPAQACKARVSGSTAANRRSWVVPSRRSGMGKDTTTQAQQRNLSQFLHLQAVFQQVGSARSKLVAVTLEPAVEHEGLSHLLHLQARATFQADHILGDTA